MPALCQRTLSINLLNTNCKNTFYFFFSYYLRQSSLFKKKKNLNQLFCYNVIFMEDSTKRDFSYSLYPTSPNVNLLYCNYDTAAKTMKLTLVRFCHLCPFPGLGSNQDITLYLAVVSQKSLIYGSLLIFPCFLRSLTLLRPTGHIFCTMSLFLVLLLLDWGCIF